MPSTQRGTTGNRLLEALPKSDLRRMLAECETVDLAFADVLYAPGERLSHVYFPTSSFIALTMAVDGSDSPGRGHQGGELPAGAPPDPLQPWQHHDS